MCVISKPLFSSFRWCVCPVVYINVPLRDCVWPVFFFVNISLFECVCVTFCLDEYLSSEECVCVAIVWAMCACYVAWHTKRHIHLHNWSYTHTLTKKDIYVAKRSHTHTLMERNVHEEENWSETGTKRNISIPLDTHSREEKNSVANWTHLLFLFQLKRRGQQQIQPWHQHLLVGGTGVMFFHNSSFGTWPSEQ